MKNKAMKDYKKILEGVVNIINTAEKSDIGFTNICTYIGENCPELAESEDEKIRKILVEAVTQVLQDQYCSNRGVSKEKVVAWLEKQGEHKKFRDSIQVGDEVTRNSDGVIVNMSQLKRVAKPAQQKLPIEKLPEEMKTIEESLGFTTQEECDEYNHIVSDLIMSGDNMEEQKSNVENKKLTDVNHEYFSELLENDNSEDINDYTYQVAYCMSHDWAIENPTWDNVQSACRLGAKWQKKHDVSEDWSEEDEKMIGRVRGIIEAYAFSQSAVDVNGDLCEKKFIDVDIWLKSIKDRVKSQNTWKPSDKQMRALEYIINNAHNTSYSCKIAKELLEQLKKLKGE